MPRRRATTAGRTSGTPPEDRHWRLMRLRLVRERPFEANGESSADDGDCDSRRRGNARALRARGDRGRPSRAISASRSPSRPANSPASSMPGRNSGARSMSRFRRSLRSPSRARRRRRPEADQQSVGHPARADGGAAGRRAVRHRQRFRGDRACRGGLRRSGLPARLRSASATCRDVASSASSGRAPAWVSRACCSEPDGP